MRIRPAEVHDTARIAEIHVATWKRAYRGLLPQPFLDQLNPAQRRPMWERILANPTSSSGALVADTGQDLVGFVHFCPTRDPDRDPAIVGEITSIYVLPTAWQTGVGKRLMTAALYSMGAAGFQHATLWVLSTNSRAIHFYTQGGWTPDNTTKLDEVGGIVVTEARFQHELAQLPN